MSYKNVLFASFIRFPGISLITKDRTWFLGFARMRVSQHSAKRSGKSGASRDWENDAKKKERKVAEEHKEKKRQRIHVRRGA